MSSMMTIVFGLFVAVVYLVLYVIDKRVKDDGKAVKASNIILLVASLFFIVYSDWRCLIILFAMAFATCWAAKNVKFIKVGIVFDIAVLCIFKYFNFFIAAFPFTFRLVMQLGLSFFVFSSIGYLVDVYRGKTETMSLTKSVLYLSYFPKFTSGPIMKSTDYMSQIRQRRTINYKGFEEGIEIFVFGLFKKSCPCRQACCFCRPGFLYTKGIWKHDACVCSYKLFSSDIPRLFWLLRYGDRCIEDAWDKVA